MNSISPGITVSPLAQHVLNSEIGDIYRAMTSASPSQRMAPQEVAIAASLLLGSDTRFITGADLIIGEGRDRRNAHWKFTGTKLSSP